MIDPKRFCDILGRQGVKFYTGVPDSLLNDFCLYLERTFSSDQHIITANEGNAIALAAGYHVATGTIPFVYMQNSGIGNAVNPLVSLTYKKVYAIPMILLIGWRGAPEVSDWAHHKKQGELTPTLLDDLEIPYRIVDNDQVDIEDLSSWATKTARELSSPVAIVARKGVFALSEKFDFNQLVQKYSLSREDAIGIIVDTLPNSTLYVATTGRATRELFEIRNQRGEGHEHDFLNVGAMGHASSIATGLAIAQKNRLVVCLDGDASAIMHMGSMATIGAIKRSNLLHVVLNNGVHESVGGQTSAGYAINMTMLAESLGYKTVKKPIETKDELVFKLEE
ncbi:MAG: phosphonopyruvate decarboxylase [Bacteroidales bacterium]|nr:phosphonopyruvate decarboxylase [Bacteroidales bacterium]